MAELGEENQRLVVSIILLTAEVSHAWLISCVR